MKAIVTGGAGFIGSHLTELLLSQGHSVLVLDNYSTGRPSNLQHLLGSSQLKVVECNIANASLESHFNEIDWVFHLAGLADIVPSIERPSDYFEANVIGTERVLEASRTAGVKRFIYAASSSCYGIPQEYPTPENAAIQPEYPYALTKRLGEELVLHWAKVYKLPALALRLFNVYGPRSRTSGTYGAVFGVFLAQKLAGKPFTVVGNGCQTRDFTFVSDVARAFYVAAQSNEQGYAMNVGSGGTYSVNELVDLLGGEVVYLPKRPGEPDCTFADTRLIQERLQWRPLISLKEGVGILLENIEYWRNAPVWNKDTIAEATAIWFQNLGDSK